MDRTQIRINPIASLSTAIRRLRLQKTGKFPSRWKPASIPFWGATRNHCLLWTGLSHVIWHGPPTYVVGMENTVAPSVVPKVTCIISWSINALQVHINLFTSVSLHFWRLQTADWSSWNNDDVLNEDNGPKRKVQQMSQCWQDHASIIQGVKNFVDGWRLRLIEPNQLSFEEAARTGAV